MNMTSFINYVVVGMDIDCVREWIDVKNEVAGQVSAAKGSVFALFAVKHIESVQLRKYRGRACVRQRQSCCGWNIYFSCVRGVRIKR